ncbi:MAG: hypothetical protein IPM56_12530 [Ignavibacteriales bacterium]|nr:MAG: hypothetical protein IPM56_12530 [Ignavibacteriales bacterium]
MKRSFLFILVIIILQLSCKENTITPPDNKPPGWQEDIPWPSLADSPWPMFRCDPQNTNRSKFSGAMTGEIEWVYEGINSQAGFSIYEDVIYQSSSLQNDPFLYAITKAGELKWKVNIGVSYSTPTITNNGRIILVASQKLVSIDTTGQILWEYILPACAGQRGINLDKTGNFYFTCENVLYCVSDAGILLWSIQNTSANVWGSQLVFSPDGNTIYIQGIGITAINIVERTIKWIFSCRGVNDLLVDNQGNIYFHSRTDSLALSLFSLKPDGNLRWSYLHNDENDFPGPVTIDYAGNLFFRGGSNIISLDYSGNFRWQKTIIPSEPIACNSQNELFITTALNGITITKLDNSGNLIWEVSTNDNSSTAGVPIICEGRMYIPSWDSNKIFSIK